MNGDYFLVEKGSYDLHKAIDFYAREDYSIYDYVTLKCFQSNIDETEYFYRFNPYYHGCYKEVNQYVHSLKLGDYGYKQIWDDVKSG